MVPNFEGFHGGRRIRGGLAIKTIMGMTETGSAQAPRFSPGDSRCSSKVLACAIGIVQSGGLRYSRLLRRTIRGRERVFVQLVLAGDLMAKPHRVVGDARVGLDLGPSQVAVVTEGHAETLAFCPGLDHKEAACRRFLRRLDRQRRAANPGNYAPDGTLKPKAQRRPWMSTAGMAATRAGLAEVLRAMAGQRKTLQGALANRVLALGNRIVTEKVDVREWAGSFGRSVGHKAPGMFQALLRRKAEASGGSMVEVSTWATCLSSRCLCGARRKKRLDERRHACGCGFVPEGTWVDRDAFSAFLACHCQEGLLDEQAARASWQAWGADCLLEPSSGIKQTATGEATPSPRGREPRQSGSVPNGSGRRREAGSGTSRAGERRGIHPPRTRQPRNEAEGTHVA